MQGAMQEHGRGPAPAGTAWGEAALRRLEPEERLLWWIIRDAHDCLKRALGAEQLSLYEKEEVRADIAWVRRTRGGSPFSSAEEALAYFVRSENRRETLLSTLRRLAARAEEKLGKESA